MTYAGVIGTAEAADGVAKDRNETFDATSFAQAAGAVYACSLPEADPGYVAACDDDARSLALLYANSVRADGAALTVSATLEIDPYSMDGASWYRKMVKTLERQRSLHPGWELRL